MSVAAAGSSVYARCTHRAPGREDQKSSSKQLQDKEKEPLIKTDKLIAICVLVTLDLDDQVAIYDV